MNKPHETWTKETPTEDGLYWQYLEVGNPQICYVCPHANRVSFTNGYVMCLSGTKAWWLKATRPEPPVLPEKGEEYDE